MRRTLAMVALAVTAMVALSFLIPLAVLLRTQVRTQATQSAEQRTAAVAPVLALSTQPADLRGVVSGVDPTGRLCVHLPGGVLIGTSHAPGALLAQATGQRESIARDVPGGWDYLQPVLLAQDRVAVVEEFVPQAALTQGVATGWTVMSLLALGLVTGSVLVADRLAAQLVRSARSLSRASNTLGGGDLDVRVAPGGPPELHEAGLAFNAMADRITQLLATERELVADLSHRLRTPLMALHLAAEQIGPVAGAQRITSAVHHLEGELDSIILAARTPLAVRPPQRGDGQGRGAGRRARPVGGFTEATEVAAHRVGFWSVLAEQQDRGCGFTATDEPTPVRVPEDDLAAVVDALVGNVFRHTPQGTAFAVTVERTAQSVLLLVDDAGPGIADPRSALSRGVSVGGSTGLGLDIARQAAAATGGQLRILRGPLGGARVEVTLGLAAESGGGGRRRWRHRRGRDGRARRRGLPRWLGRRTAR
ncbi:sensor histidine kinase [Kitasatospora sp. NPDC052896]|uniref:sensor histidine kinase n=1 Tax=Kitasatospora sp. NPDC052896 TaxID=3364061 RepID=UPI0037C87B46